MWNSSAWATNPSCLNGSVAGAPFAGTLSTDRIEVVTGRGESPTALLIRPDGYVAWAADHDGIAEQEGLRTALAQWFGVHADQERPLTSATR
ncbi:hypothetical protein [Kribbella sp. NPDC049227]|uniref:aromatic-ring hydroxylase C-terminal domain-containing protein n=1 Tax=Kribbella sp. NPDC049227 TaxID=3364113 RepID=UPI003719EB38